MLVTLLSAACASTPERMTQAVLAGDAAELDGLLKPGSADVNTPVTLETAPAGCPKFKTLTPLQAAACTGQAAAVQKLLASGADVDLATGAGLPPLLLAGGFGHEDAARVLVKAGARIDGSDGSGNTALMFAAFRGYKGLAELLLGRGASLTPRNSAGETALLLSTNADLSRTLVALGADPLAVNAQGESGLHLAARRGDAEAARFFLERGVDPLLRSASGATALQVARGGSERDPAPATVSREVALIKQQRLAGAGRGRPVPGSAPAPSAGPQRGEAQPAVVAVLEQWIEGSVRQEEATADRAAQEGRSADALALYGAALSRAGEVRGRVEQDLRVKLVRYAGSLPEPPGIPEKAREHLVRGSYLLKKGQDVSLVENEMVAALRVAPWWAEGYYNLGQLQAQQGKHDVAERNLRLFIAGAPGDPRAQAAQDRIYEIGMAREEDGKIRGMQGRWVDAGGRGYSVTVQGEQIHIRSDGGLAFTLSQRNGVVEGSVEGRPYAGEHKCTIPGQMHPVNGRLAPDARTIQLEHLWSTYKTRWHCVNMAGVPSNCCLLCDEVCDAVTVSGTNRVSLQLRPAR